MLVLQATGTNRSTLMNPALGSHGYITRAMSDLLSLTRKFVGTLGLNSVRVAPEPARFTLIGTALIGTALIGFALITRKPRRG